MSTTQTEQIIDILNVVSAWPPAQRLSLAKRLLDTLSADLSEQALPRKKSLKDLVGLIKIDGPPPTDEECDKMREEALRERLGL